MSVKRLLLVVTCLVAFGACSLDKQTAPDLTGPSGLGLSIVLRATPDVLFRDGVSQSTIEVTATDENGQPVNNLGLFFAATPNLGTLSVASSATNAQGRATVTFTAPGDGADAMATVTVTPVGGANNKFQNSLPRTVTVRLVRLPA